MREGSLPDKKTKIVCTLGPASEDADVIEAMIRNGMNVARINFAHGELADHRRTIAKVRNVAEDLGVHVAVLADLPGPKMRIGELVHKSVELERGQAFVLTTEAISGDRERVSVNLPDLPKAVRPGDSIYINDGYVQLEVNETVGREVRCTVLAGGEIRSHKGVNFPGIDLGVRAFTDEDRKFLSFAAEETIDAVSQSFVRHSGDVEDVRAAAEAMGYRPFLVAKIERAGALDEIDGILRSADGVMVARGDLGVEIPIERIPVTQKRLIRSANRLGKPVITATQMLESMTAHRRPTRAEVTDVANAILDGTDAVMLSEETAIGAYPEDTVETMARIAREIEVSGGFTLGLNTGTQNEDLDDKISANVREMARSLDPGWVIVPSRRGDTARRVTRFRLRQWIIAPSRSLSTCRELQFSFGVHPVFAPGETDLATAEARRSFVQRWLARHGATDDLAVLVEGSGTFEDRPTRRIEVFRVEPTTG